MNFSLVLSLLILLFCQTTLGVDFGSLLRSGKTHTEDTLNDITEMHPEIPLHVDSDSDALNSSEERYMDSTINGISSSTTDNNNQSQTSENSTRELKIGHSISTSTTSKGIGNSTNESSSQSSQSHSFSESSTSASELNSTESMTSKGTSSSNLNKSSTQPEDEEPEQVVIGKPSNSSSTVIVRAQQKTFYQRALEAMNDTYTLSIILPIAAGIVFAATIIVVITTCRCMKRQCRRRRLRRKTLPDSVKNLRPSDRARLLAESSDEEF